MRLLVKFCRSGSDFCSCSLKSRVMVKPRLATEIAGYGPDVVAAAPDTVRDAVVHRLTAVLRAAS